MQFIWIEISTWLTTFSRKTEFTEFRRLDNVNIIKLIARNTIDEYIDEIISKKQNLAGYVQGDIENIEFELHLTKE